MEDVFETLIKVFQDIRRARTRMEAIDLSLLDPSSRVLTDKIKDEIACLLKYLEEGDTNGEA